MEEVLTVSNERERFIEIVMRQTEYTYEEANKALDKNDNNYIRVIKDAMGIKDLRGVENKFVDSINQTIYKNIREYMDNNKVDIKERSQKDDLSRLEQIKE